MEEIVPRVEKMIIGKEPGFLVIDQSSLSALAHL